jgi:hypothetical protein
VAMSNVVGLKNTCHSSFVRKWGRRQEW